ncbi:MAG TPA: CGNR zinc finger domain-containing protein [Ilumatobacteraceae bacterium]|nr:CGNR zinc finger domain-containing protein [Ilumatobacteraceae bacterium]
MYVTSGHDTEVRLTIEALVDLVNALGDAAADPDGEAVDVRTLLDEHRFSRAAGASAAAIHRVEERVGTMVETLLALPGSEPEPTVAWTNAQLSDIHITPSLTDHDGADLHIHWTPASATFDDQVIADFLMALAQEVCDHGTTRFGTCAATDCGHLFYDVTRNGSRRFCADPRCASRTHTADHRARRRTS